MANKLRPSLTPGFVFSFGLLCITIALCAIMLVWTSTRAHAQPQPQRIQCILMSELKERMATLFHERQMWQGVAITPNGPVETFLYQSPGGETWTIIDVVGKDPMGNEVGCFVRNGNAGVPNEIGRGA